MAPTGCEQRKDGCEFGDFPEATAFQRENKRKSQRAVDRAPSPAGYIARTCHVNFRWSMHYATLAVYTIYRFPSVLTLSMDKHAEPRYVRNAA